MSTSMELDPKALEVAVEAFYIEKGDRHYGSDAIGRAIVAYLAATATPAPVPWRVEQRKVDGKWIAVRNGDPSSPSFAYTKQETALAYCKVLNAALEMSAELSPTPEPASDPRYPLALAEATARAKGENLDGSPRRECSSVAPSPTPVSGWLEFERLRSADLASKALPALGAWRVEQRKVDGKWIVIRNDELASPQVSYETKDGALARCERLNSSLRRPAEARRENLEKIIASHAYAPPKSETPE